MKEFFKRNKRVLLIALALFLVVAVASAIASFMIIGDKYGMISSTIYQMKANGTMHYNETVSKSNTFDLFLHNVISDLLVIIGGLFFSVISVFAIIYNAIIIGTPFGSDFTYYSVTILPHGIIEYAAAIISLACAFNITKLEVQMIRNRNVRDTLAESKRELRDILIMVAVVIVLLAIAAVIECNLVEPIFRWYFGI